MAKRKIVCWCYGDRHLFNTKKEALAFFKDCARNSEGSERDRYMNIIFQLEEGKRNCYDLDYNVRY